MKDDFNKFMGMEIAVKIEKHKIGQDEFEEIVLDEDDENYKKLVAFMEDNYTSYRIWGPSTMGTMDYLPFRANVHFEESDNGTYRISDLRFG
ncbi:MAG: hypothetical protein CMP22_05880 [Rickettsiales bacterium]|nr:hypothetical protein [Rickettsiales bacterium]|tara:strand:+ start:955 stop:1230 length:276 start_codon:yes stop_codon:yes gene_type:complete